jgi:hypothetical protein
MLFASRKWPGRMRIMSRTFSGTEFVAALAAGPLKRQIVKVGMVKPDDSPDAIQFAEGTNCSGWSKIPVQFIETVEFIGNVTCKDHEHPLIALELADPTSDEAAVFADLLRNTARQRPTQQRAGRRPDLASLVAAMQGTGSAVSPELGDPCETAAAIRWGHCVRGPLGPTICGLLFELEVSNC